VIYRDVLAVFYQLWWSSDIDHACDSTGCEVESQIKARPAEMLEPGLYHFEVNKMSSTQQRM